MSNVATQQDQELSAEELTFAKLVAKGMSGVSAYRQAFPAKKDRSYGYLRQLASELLTKTNIITEVQTTRERQARMVRLAEERIEDILVNDSSSVKGNKVAEVAMFMYEQANGKATQRTVVEGRHVMVTYDLSNGQAGPVPQEVLDKLEED